MKHFLFVALIGLIFAFAGPPANVLSQSLVDGHVALSDFDINESPTCDLAEAQAPSESVACVDDAKHEIDPVDKGERSIQLLVAETEDAEQLFKAVVQDSQRKYLCTQPQNPTPGQIEAFQTCRDNLPNCDSQKWEESEDGTLILICKCRWLFSSC